MGTRNLYLKTTPINEAKAKYEARLTELNILVRESEEVDTYNALNRITSRPIYAKCCSPLYNSAAMDGIAVISKETREARLDNPIRLKKGVGYKIVDTGDPVEAPFDAVIMAEDVNEEGSDMVITKAAAEWQHVRAIGEDIVASEMILPSNHLIRPIDIGIMLASGSLSVSVYRRPRVGIIPTGSEIIEPKNIPEKGDIIDSNSGMISALVNENGGIPKRYNIVKDDYDLIKEAVLKGVSENDILLVNAGSSAGTEDYTVHVLRELGEVLVHGVAMKPGKPVMLAIVNNKPVIGLPGYPVSAYLAFENFVKPLLEYLNGHTEKKKNIIKAVVSKRIVSSLKHEEYVRVKVGKVSDRYVCAPLNRGAASQMSLARADGFLIVPRNSEGFEAGEEREVIILKDESELENTLVSIGSHDMLMDIASDLLAKNYPGYNLSSTHVGSLAGLMALKRNETIIAPTHLLSKESGIYNIEYIKEIFPNEEMCLIRGVGRVQGIIVKKGNPENIKSIKDLKGKTFVNRQRGAGTRVLFDYLLEKEGISPSEINGYDKEVKTHMEVAAQVNSGEVDAGMGIKSAGTIMNLDFVEVGLEEYQFAIHKKDLDSPLVKAFIETIKSDEFKKELEKIGGYELSNLGEIIYVK